jgi:hypothetical protein
LSGLLSIRVFWNNNHHHHEQTEGRPHKVFSSHIFDVGFDDSDERRQKAKRGNCHQSITHGFGPEPLSKHSCYLMLCLFQYIFSTFKPIMRLACPQAAKCRSITNSPSRFRASAISQHGLHPQAACPSSPERLFGAPGHVRRYPARRPAMGPESHCLSGSSKSVEGPVNPIERLPCHCNQRQEYQQ